MSCQLCSASVSRLTVTPTAGCVDFKHIARLHFCLANVGKFFDPTIGAHHAVDAQRA